MLLSASNMTLIYLFSAVGALALLVWLGFQIVRLIRSSGEVVKTPED